MQEIEMKLPPEQVRLTLWERAVPEGSRGPEVVLPSLARAFNLTPGEIVDTADEARRIAEGDGGRPIAHEDLRFGVERRLRNELGETARRVTVSVKWEDLVLPPEYLDRINEFISRKLYADKVFNEWGFGERVGYGRGMVALFSGPPGTGKTMLAGLIAKTLDLELYQVDLANVVSKWIGETEKQLSKVFDQAERAHAVLLFDEADSLFAKRTEVKSSNDRYGNLAVNYLLQRLEQYTGIAILTTNKEAVVDEALQRRLSLHLHFQIPDQAERERLWTTFLPEKAPRAEDIDLTDLAREYELSGGHIKNAALRAAFLAAALQTDISMDHLRRAAVLELEDMGRLAYRPEGLRGADGNRETVRDFVEG
jgi:SpoVK/Ycf46/Vps4 family AAA+-type ATPase